MLQSRNAGNKTGNAANTMRDQSTTTSNPAFPIQPGVTSSATKDGRIKKTI